MVINFLKIKVLVLDTKLSLSWLSGRKGLNDFPNLDVDKDMMDRIYPPPPSNNACFNIYVFKLFVLGKRSTYTSSATCDSTDCPDLRPAGVSPLIGH